MNMYKRADVLLIKYPFSDPRHAKLRPALVMLDCGDEDVLVAKITSHGARSPFDVFLRNWKYAGLLFPSVVRLHKMATLEKKLVIRRIGYLGASDLRSIASVFRKLWSGYL